MRRSRLAVHALCLLGLFLQFRPACADTSVAKTPTVGVTIGDFSYLDTSGEVADQVAVHEKRLRAFMAALRGDVEADRRYRLIPPSCAPRCADEGPEPSKQTQANARIRIVGAIKKMSTLVQLAKVAIVDLDTNQVLWDRLYTFRGDNDEAWERAEAFVSREIREVLAASLPASSAAAPAPIGLAVFDFELEDTTAAPAATGLAPSDVEHLADVTNGVRQLLAQSGRYRVIDVGGASADAVKERALRDCGGCDAAIARELGADQSLIGVVRRVSRTEYTIGFQIRDARTGAVVSRADSGLRMGADYSWRRGALRLVGDRLLEGQSQR
jgi:Protein of unknown function (DUF2380)